MVIEVLSLSKWETPWNKLQVDGFVEYKDSSELSWDARDSQRIVKDFIDLLGVNA